jgi:hypothetical protein
MPAMSDEIVLTAEERRFFWFFPPAEHVQQSLLAKGLVAKGSDGRCWMTVLGDQVRLGAHPSRTEG